MSIGENQRPHCDCGSKRRLNFLVPLLLAALAALFFRETISRRLGEHVVLANDAPSEVMLLQTIQRSPDPQAELLAVWNAGKIVPREMAIRFIASVAPVERPCPPPLESVLLAGALDPDENVRETALGALSARHDPALTALAAAQLRDADPQIRLLGLLYLKHLPAELGLPLAVPLLDDADLRVVGEVLNLMNNWSGEDFGVKLRDALPAESATTGLLEYPLESAAKVRAGVERAKTWLDKHRAEFNTVASPVPPEALAALHAVSAPDFALPSLDGPSVRLSSFRGKVVVLNFWTTWCTACIAEMPELAELKKRHDDRLAILGTSLDFTPDEDEGDKSASVSEIRAKVARVARQRGINYPVLLDETGAIGARYNGGELPTTVIIDAEGNVRRRFIGARAMPVLEAFIAAASRPVESGAVDASPQNGISKTTH
jgi:thiol-disulfide isomerase/thioredoxin